MTTNASKKKVAEEKELTTQEIQALVEKDKLKRQQACQLEIEAILQKYQCELIAIPRYLEGRTVADVLINNLA